MKRNLALLLMVTILLSTAVAWAAPVDLKKMNNEELLSLRISIEAEVLVRGLTKQNELWQALMTGAMGVDEYSKEMDKLHQNYTLEQLQTQYLATLEAIWNTKEWQEVEVPAGVYEVGVEIPAGEWTLRNNRSFLVGVGSSLDATKTTVENRKAYEYIKMNDYKNGWTVNLIKGDFIEISDVVYFTIPVKGQGFTFK